jgi:hypothetical protein
VLVGGIKIGSRLEGWKRRDDENG